MTASGWLMLGIFLVVFVTSFIVDRLRERDSLSLEAKTAMRELSTLAKSRAKRQSIPIPQIVEDDGTPVRGVPIIQMPTAKKPVEVQKPNGLYRVHKGAKP